MLIQMQLLSISKEIMVVNEETVSKIGLSQQNLFFHELKCPAC